MISPCPLINEERHLLATWSTPGLSRYLNDTSQPLMKTPAILRYGLALLFTCSLSAGVLACGSEDNNEDSNTTEDNSTPGDTSASKGDASMGQQLFTDTSCTVCHNIDGSTSPNANGLGLTEADERHTTEMLTEIIARGVSGTAMIGYQDRGILTADEISHLVAFVESLD